MRRHPNPKPVDPTCRFWAADLAAHRAPCAGQHGRTGGNAVGVLPEADVSRPTISNLYRTCVNCTGHHLAKTANALSVLFRYASEEPVQATDAYTQGDCEVFLGCGVRGFPGLQNQSVHATTALPSPALLRASFSHI
jgi:hypothetical protein